MKTESGVDRLLGSRCSILAKPWTVRMIVALSYVSLNLYLHKSAMESMWLMHFAPKLADSKG